MSERKSRFGDRSALPEDPALRVLQLRRGPESSSAPITYPGRAAAADQEALVVRIKKAREEANEESSNGKFVTRCRILGRLVRDRRH